MYCYLFIYLFCLFEKEQKEKENQTKLTEIKTSSDLFENFESHFESNLI